jgi:hypothetical protein
MTPRPSESYVLTSRRPTFATPRSGLVTLALLAIVGCSQPGQDQQASFGVENVTSALTSGDVQINCGNNGAIPPFIADTDFLGGAGKTRNNVIDLTGVVDPAPMAVYQSQHYASPFTYTIPGFTAGSNQLIRLHFAETNPSTTLRTSASSASPSTERSRSRTSISSRLWA